MTIEVISAVRTGEDLVEISVQWPDRLAVYTFVRDPRPPLPVINSHDVWQDFRTRVDVYEQMYRLAWRAYLGKEIVLPVQLPTGVYPPRAR
ncbi:hypothetical protein Lfu02_43130 [Longispora fulva]|uniref:Uncharacterized protein n=1 Tax=Longispora fulva TaxID=619741 RepID=A0A8J7KFY9_9ACTN|nr:hypothetical protein [Longispora fulva]MBG6136770.1 hypothetical protein [Longispora fulva]GIG59941.1 hypothetical protein Lfu02_43130 [Longispora fulva]